MPRSRSGAWRKSSRASSPRRRSPSAARSRIASISAVARRVRRRSSSTRSHRRGSISPAPVPGTVSSLKGAPHWHRGRRHTLPFERIAEADRAPARSQAELLDLPEEELEPAPLLGPEVVVDVRLQVRLNRLGRELQPHARLHGDRRDIGHPDPARLEERPNAVRHGHAPPPRPHGEDERQAREGAPLRRQIQNEESRGIGRQRRVAYQEGRVVVAQHLPEGRWLLRIPRVAHPLVPQDRLQKSARGARVRIEGHAPDRLHRDERDQDDRAHAALRGDAELRQELHARQTQVFDRRDQADVRLPRAQKIRNAARGHLPDPEDAPIRSSQEAPGERLGIDEWDRSDSYFFHRIALTLAGRGTFKGGAFYQNGPGSQSAGTSRQPRSARRAAARAPPRAPPPTSPRPILGPWSAPQPPPLAPVPPLV